MFRPVLAQTWVKQCALARMMSGAGSIREAGGAFGKKEKAIEDQYFRNMQRDQLKHLVDNHSEEIRHHQESIKRHEEAIKKHEQALKK
eukprot:maker-scaffold6911_size3517-snap-gene-0.1 protein:Tk02433 transcript:maker-scaffold6911_size3517-snap-gene-0.1-mRNA-1 annotation:"if1 protein"